GAACGGPAFPNPEHQTPNPVGRLLGAGLVAVCASPHGCGGTAGRGAACRGVGAGPLALAIRSGQAATAGPATGAVAGAPPGYRRPGRDLLTRIMYGGRISLSIGILAMALAVLIGPAVGARRGFVVG